MPGISAARHASKKKEEDYPKLVVVDNIALTTGAETNTVSDEINELFDLAAPPLEKPVVARLVPSAGALLSLDAHPIADPEGEKSRCSDQECSSFTGQTILLHTDSDCCTIGRSKDLFPPFRIEHVDKISAKHCNLFVQPATLAVHIQDISANGTFLNGKRLVKGKMVELQAGDRIQLTKPVSLPVEAKGHDDGPRRPIVEYCFQRIKETRSLSSLVSSLTCSLCSQVVYRPCHVFPCLHAFCGHCISEFVKDTGGAAESEGGDVMHDEESQHSRVWMTGREFRCPTCHQQLHSIRPSHKLEISLAQLLKIEPKRRRTSAKAVEWDSKDIIPAGGLVFKRNRTDDGSDDNSFAGTDEETGDAQDWCSRSMGSWSENSGSGVDSEAKKAERRSPHCAVKVAGAFIRCVQSYYPQFLGKAFAASTTRCRECDSPSLIDGFQCGWTSSLSQGRGSGTIKFPKHLQCRACWQPFPERPLCSRPQRCFLCATPFCNAYFGAGERDEKGGCAALATDSSLGLKSVEEHIVKLKEGIPMMTFGGNTVEQSILLKYMVSHGIPEQQIRRDCIKGLREGRWRPDVHSLSGVVSSSSAVCSLCADQIYAGLLFHYRRNIPREDLPETVTDRPHCWSGIQCHAQHQSLEHAERYHHVCYPEKRKE